MNLLHRSFSIHPFTEHQVVLINQQLTQFNVTFSNLVLVDKNSFLYFPSSILMVCVISLHHYPESLDTQTYTKEQTYRVCISVYHTEGNGILEMEDLTSGSTAADLSSLHRQLGEEMYRGINGKRLNLCSLCFFFLERPAP